MNNYVSSSETPPVTYGPLRSKVAGLAEHEARFKLHSELHAAPAELLQAPTSVSHLALLSDDETIADELGLIAQLCDRYRISPPTPDARYFSAQFGLFRLKWERHTEFSTYTFFVAKPFDVPFAEPAISHVSKEWLASLPGEVIAAVHVAIESKDKPRQSLEELARHFASNTVIGAEVAAGNAVVWTDNVIHNDGFSRILIHDVDLRKRQAGRLVQRLLEIETYRMLAMLPVPMAREYLPMLADFDERLAELTHKNTTLNCVEDEQTLLDELTRLAAEIERISALTNHRFNASAAYYKIVEQRVAELRERRIQGLQMFHEFMKQYLTSAMATCASVNSNLDTLAMRVARASDLLRTRVDITLEGQTRDLLSSMDKRARIQLRLQETVEGLSVVVLSYYLLGILAYGFKGAKSAGLPVNVELATGIAIPVVLLTVFLGVKRLRRFAENGIS